MLGIFNMKIKMGVLLLDCVDGLERDRDEEINQEEM